MKNIQTHAQSLITPLKTELRKQGYTLLTPMEERTPMVACALPDARTRLADRLEAANVHITLSRNRFRVSASVFNDEQDLERLITVLGKA